MNINDHYRIRYLLVNIMVILILAWEKEKRMPLASDFMWVNKNGTCCCCVKNVAEVKREKNDVRHREVHNQQRFVKLRLLWTPQCYLFSCVRINFSCFLGTARNPSCLELTRSDILAGGFLVNHAVSCIHLQYTLCPKKIVNLSCSNYDITWIDIDNFLAKCYWKIKAKFHYAIWFKAGSKLVADLQRAEIWHII